jgi:hypothetical protein
MAQKDENKLIDECSEYYYIKKVKPPSINENIVESYRNIISKLLLKKSNIKKQLILGAIKFKDNENIEYIHCPIVNNTNENENICIGICKHFESVKNDSSGKKHLATHKYQYHYKCNSMKKHINSLQIFLKTNKSIEEVLEDYKNKELRKGKNKNKII